MGLFSKRPEREKPELDPARAWQKSLARAREAEKRAREEAAKNKKEK